MQSKTSQKDVFKHILIWFVAILIFLPPFAALNSVMTKWLDRAQWYKPIQTYIVPWQAKLVSVTLKPFAVESKVTPDNVTAAFFMIKNGAAIPVDLSWNCLGWQSMLLLIMSLIIGLKGNYTFFSRVKIIIFGLFGTLLVNVLRMSIIAIMIYYVSSFAALIVHDYFASFVTLIWLSFFWWFSYRYILVNSTDEII